MALTSVIVIIISHFKYIILDSSFFSFVGIWAETLELHDQVFLGIGLCGGFALILVTVFCFRKHKMRHNYQRPQPSGKVHL